MRVSVVRPDELGHDEAIRWQKFQLSSPTTSHPCLSLTYARAVGQIDDKTRIAVAEDAGQVVAFLPYRLENRRMAVPLGGSSGLDGLVHPSDRPVDVRVLIRQAGLRGYRFYHAPTEQNSLAPYRYDYNFHGTTIYAADLSGGYENYSRALPQSVTKRISRTATYRRSLERRVGEVAFEWNSFSRDYFDQLVRWKSGQYDNARRELSKPGMISLVQQLATSAENDCSGVMSVLLAGGRPAAIVLSLRAQNLLAPWILAYDPDLSRFSPGMIEWLAILEDAPRHGVTRIDFGYGEDSYKRRLGNTSYQATGGGVWASELEATARSAYRKVRYRRGHGQAAE